MFGAVLDDWSDRLIVQRQGGSAEVNVPLTISDDGMIETAVEVRLWQGHWQGVPIHEFKYAIVIRDRGSGSTRDVFDRFEAAPYIAPVRASVVPVVVAATKALIASVSPPLIYRATYLSRPPVRSLSKHHQITDILVALGYDVLRQGLDAKDRQFWLMVKR